MATSKKPSKPTKSKKAVKVGALPPYGVPIYQAIKRGNQAEMRRQAAAARRWLVSTQTALTALEKAIGKKK